MTKTDFTRFGNSIALAGLLCTILGLTLAAHRKAMASVNGPCPLTVAVIACGERTERYEDTGTTSCMECNPFYGPNGNTYYDCATYEQWNKYCDNVYVGTEQRFLRQTNYASGCVNHTCSLPL